MSEGANDAGATSAVVLEDLFDGTGTGRDRRHFHGPPLKREKGIGFEVRRWGFTDRSGNEALCTSTGKGRERERVSEVGSQSVWIEN